MQVSMVNIISKKKKIFFVVGTHSLLSGFGLVEIIVVVSIVTVALWGFLQSEIFAFRLFSVEKKYQTAAWYGREGIEAMRAVRDESWAANIAGLLFGTSYYPVIQNGKWKLTQIAPPKLDGMYDRSLVINRVYRDESDQIAPSGTEDTRTRKVTSRVTWENRTVEFSTYITDFQSSLAPLQESKVIFYEGATEDGDLAHFPSQDLGEGDPAESFTTPSSPQYRVTRVDLFLRNATTTPSPIYVELRKSATSAALATSQTITSSTIATTSLAWVEFRFSPAILLATSTTYFLRVRSIPSSTDAASGSAGTMRWAYATPGTYPDGKAYRYIGRLSNPLDAGDPLDGYDFGFRVYALQ